MYLRAAALLWATMSIYSRPFRGVMSIDVTPLILTCVAVSVRVAPAVCNAIDAGVVFIGHEVELKNK